MGDGRLLAIGGGSVARRRPLLAWGWLLDITHCSHGGEDGRLLDDGGHPSTARRSSTHAIGSLLAVHRVPCSHERRGTHQPWCSQLLLDAAWDAAEELMLVDVRWPPVHAHYCLPSASRM
ncbi:hypothetical protein Dimus_037661 [Dionaea muscipula]